VTVDNILPGSWYAR